jgi:hypothetical protein
MTIKHIQPGTRFNRLTFLEDAGLSKGLRRWKVQCDCGTIKICEASSVARGHTKSCGCLHIEKTKCAKYKKHGMCNTPTYNSWSSMLSRCMDINKPSYCGKGITVCERWKTFENFYSDMGERPAGMTIDRIDPHGNYESSNCRWATEKQQHRNTTRNLLITYNGLTKPLVDWAEQTGIARATISARLKKGWTIEDSLTKPVRPY